MVFDNCDLLNKIMLYNSTPCADIMREHFKVCPGMSQFRYMYYFGFNPLTQYGSNGRKIHVDFDEYWEN